MVLWWAMTIGFTVCLGIAGGTLVHFLKQALDGDDAKRIDKIKTD